MKAGTEGGDLGIPLSRASLGVLGIHERDLGPPQQQGTWLPLHLSIHQLVFGSHLPPPTFGIDCGVKLPR